MKKQLVVIGISSVLALSGCSTSKEQSQIKPVHYDRPKLQETVNYTSVKYEGHNQGSSGIEAQMEQQYLLERNNGSNNSGNPRNSKQNKQAPQQEVVTAVEQQQPQQIIIKQQPRQEKIKITGVGYGAESTYEGFTDGQRRLMAIRASKLDAYRSLAEQLYGIKIDSNTSVSTLTAQSDSFRARVNAVVKGARIVSITPMSDNNYETVLEVFVDRRFFEDVFVYTGNQHDRVLEPIETCSMGFNCYEAANYR